MLSETPSMVEATYHQQHLLAEAQAYRLARSLTPARKHRLAALGRLTHLRPREHQVSAAAGALHRAA